MKDAQCDETNEKSYFKFLAFEIWSVKGVTIRLQKKVVLKWPNLQNRCGFIRKRYFNSRVFFCATFSFGDMVDFVFNSGQHSTLTLYFASTCKYVSKM